MRSEKGGLTKFAKILTHCITGVKIEWSMEFNVKKYKAIELGKSFKKRKAMKLDKSTKRLSWNYTRVSGLITTAHEKDLGIISEQLVPRKGQVTVETNS